MRAVTVDELHARSKLALRWLKAIGYAGLFRYQDMTPVMYQLAAAVVRRWRGTLDDLATDLSGHDRAAVYGAVAADARDGLVLGDQVEQARQRSRIAGRVVDHLDSPDFQRGCVNTKI